MVLCESDVKAVKEHPDIKSSLGEGVIGKLQQVIGGDETGSSLIRRWFSQRYATDDSNRNAGGRIKLQFAFDRLRPDDPAHITTHPLYQPSEATGPLRKTFSRQRLPHCCCRITLDVKVLQETIHQT